MTRSAMQTQSAHPVERLLLLSPGGSGTRSLFFELCDLGLPTVHSLVECNGGSATRAVRRSKPRFCRLTNSDQVQKWYGNYLGKEATRLAACRAGADWFGSITVHDRLQTLWKGAASCAKSPASCRLRRESWVAQVRLRLAQFSRAAYSVSDTPYASFLSGVAAHADSTTHCSRVLLSLRNASDLAHAAVNRTPWDPICSRQLWPLVGSPLDLLECAVACSSVRLAGCFETSGRVGLRRLTVAFERGAAMAWKLFGSAATVKLFGVTLANGALRRMPRDEIRSTLAAVLKQQRRACRNPPTSPAILPPALSMLPPSVQHHSTRPPLFTTAS